VGPRLEILPARRASDADLASPIEERRSGNAFLKASRENFFGNVDNFSFLQVIPFFRNFKFLAGNVSTGGDINSVAQRFTKELSMPLYAVTTLWLRMFPMRY
jgi:hypothetical protein